jgi:hypothetical protein
MCEGGGHFVSRDVVQERQTNAGVVSRIVPKLLTEEVSFRCRAKTLTGRSAFIVRRKPSFGGYDEYAGGVVSAIFAPFGPSNVRAARLLFQIKLVERNRYLRLSEQLSKPAYGSTVLRAFVTVANENMLSHSYGPVFSALRDPELVHFREITAFLLNLPRVWAPIKSVPKGWCFGRPNLAKS